MNKNSEKKELILIVDDCPENLQLLGKILKSFGFDYIIANSGKEALTKIEKSDVDLILLDIMMPEMDGFEVCKILKSNKKTTDIPVIMLTALLETKNLVRAFEVGALDYIVKPVKPSELHSRINTHLKLKREVFARKKVELELEKQKENLEYLVQEQVIALKDALAKEEVANKMKDDFLSTISHEIRTPINGILGICQLLQSDKKSSQEQRYIDIIFNSSKYLHKILTEILDFSKLQKHILKVNEDVFSLKETLQEVFDLKKTEISKKALKYIINFDENIAELYLGDSRRIQQIVINLLDNAIKFTQKGSIFLNVKTKACDENIDEIFISIVDTGIGISENKINFVFEKFTQIDSSSTRKHNGSGLGLAISQELARLMNGNIALESSIGKGSSFTFNLKMKITKKTKINKNKIKKIINRAPSDRIKTLIVDDNSSNRFIAELMLQDLGCETDFAENGYQAVQFAHIKKYDIIFMDCMMPVLNGFDATLQIRENEKAIKQEPTPIIALTGNNGENDTKQSLNSGMNEHLVKPIMKDVFREILVKYCGLKNINCLKNDKTIKNIKIEKIESDKEFDMEQLQQLIDLSKKNKKNLIKVFLSYMDEEIRLLNKAILAQNAKSVILHSHTIKGIVGNLGGIKLAQIATDIEKVSDDYIKCEEVFELFTLEKKSFLEKIESIVIDS